MITNERQYRVARTRAERLIEELSRLRIEMGASATAISDLQIAALAGQVSELEAEILDYEALRSDPPVLEVKSFEDLPTFLIRARVACGLTQAQLAERIGVAEQQVQRWESERYATASFARIAAIAQALGVTFRGRGITERQIASDMAIVRNAEAAGLTSRFISRRLLPPGAGEAGGVATARAPRLAAVIGRIFNQDPLEILSGRPIAPSTASLAGARFKLPEAARTAGVTAYAAYAKYVAGLVATASASSKSRVEGINAGNLREIAGVGSASDRFASLVAYSWSIGIPVLPLTDEGTFHAATWHLGDVDVIVLKQRTTYAARWAFDLLHELHHIAANDREDGSGVVDVVDSLSTASNDQSERDANEFAASVLLGEDSNSLAREAVARAKGKVEWLKRIVPEISAARGVDAESFANFLAYRLSLQGLDWWGAATNLQSRQSRPDLLTRDVLLAHCDFSRVDEFDRELLMEALVNE